LSLAAHLARRPEQGLALNWMGLVALEQGEPARARGYFEQALTIARGASDRLLEAKALNNLGKTAGEMERDYGAARAYYEQTYAIDHERGDRSAEGISLANLGFVTGAQGDFVSAREYHDRALAVAREIGDPYVEAYTLINLSAVSGILGDAATALQQARDAEALALRLGDRSALGWALLYKGHGQLLLAEFEQAEEAFRACISIREELQQAGLATEPMAGLILAALALGDMERAAQWTETVMGHLAAGGTLDGTEEPLRVYLACYQALKARGDARSKSVLKDAYTMLEAQVSRFRGEEARRMYVEKVPWRLAVRQAWNERDAA
ncbi:MAG: tetratricopeptide repeat protein, partial [Anaerolineae bacterium]